MKETVRIESKLGNTEWTAKSRINGKWMVLTENWHLISEAEFQTNPIFKMEKIVKKTFTPMLNYWEFDYDTEYKKLLTKAQADADPHLDRQIREWNDLNERKQRAVREFLSRHEMIEQKTDFRNGHRPSSAPIATIEVISQKEKALVEKDRMKVKIFNMVEAMSWQEQYDLALYYAPYLFGKRRSQVLHGLIGLKDVGTGATHLGGVLWRDNNGEDFLTNYKTNQNVSIKIYASKAERMGILKRGEHNGLYLSSGTFVGNTIDEAVIYFAKDERAYTQILQPEVNKASNLPEDDMTVLVGHEMLTIKPTGYEKELGREIASAESRTGAQMLKEEFMELGGTWPVGGMTRGELTIEVDKLRKLKTTKADKENLPTTQLDLSIDDIETNDIERLRVLAKEEGVKGYQVYQNIENLRSKVLENRLAKNPIV